LVLRTDDNKFSTLAEIQKAFNERWGDQKEDSHLLAALSTSQKKENETMEEFNKKFSDLVKSLSQTIKPLDTSILIHYMEAFEGEIRYQLRDKEPTTLKDAQKYAIRIDKNRQDARKSTILGFSRGTSSKTNEEKKKKKVENQESPSDGIKELTQLIKQMEINQANQMREHASQMTAMQNRLVAMERDQANRSHHKPNDKWPKIPPPQEQRPPNPFESTNLVNHQVIPYYRPCGEFHEELICPIFREICGEEGFSQSKNEQVNMCGQKYNVGMNDWMELTEHGRDVNCMNDVVDKKTKRFSPKPTPKQVSDLARYRGLTYQRNGTRNQDKPQASVPKIPLFPPKSIFPIDT
jgi:hypothetical protein